MPERKFVKKLTKEETRSPKVRGNIEAFDGEFLSGWASDGTSQPLSLRFSINGFQFLHAPADLDRQDVLKSGFTKIGCGFSVRIPQQYLQSRGVVNVVDEKSGEEIFGSPYIINEGMEDMGGDTPFVSAQATPLQGGGPARINPEKHGFVGRLNGNVERFDGRMLSGWVSDGGVSPLYIKIYINTIFYAELRADLPRQDVIEAGLASTNSGFVMEIPAIFLVERCELKVVESASGIEVFGSPILLEPSPLQPAEESSDLIAISDIVGGVTERTSDIKKLQQNVFYILQWLQHSVDRLNALKQIDAIKFDRLNEVVANNGGLSGSIGHFYGIVQQAYPQIRMNSCQNPRVSIVIPAHNKFDLTYHCIESISDARTDVTFEVILVDDCSNDETLLASLIFSGNFYTVRTQKNEGFVRACNAGASRAQGEYILFLNNDTLVGDGWLDSLSDTLSRDASIGIVGSRLVFADGALQEAGGIVWRDGSAWNWGRGQEKKHPTYSFMRDADYVSGAALMIRGDLFRQLGGFDAVFEPAYYEDTDLCFRVRSAGHRVVVQPASTITHLEGQSNGTSLSSGLKRYQGINAKKFRHRWAATLVTHQLNGVNPSLEAERMVSKRALFIDETTPTPDQDAGSNAILQHMLSVQRLGYKVVFLPADNMAYIPGYTEQIQALGIECWYAPFSWSVEEYFRRTDAKFDLVYIHRRANAQRYLHIARKYAPSARIVFNYADIHALREIREAQVSNAPMTVLTKLESELEGELDIATCVDAAIVHSTFEADLIRRSRPSANVHYVPWTVDVVSGGITFGGRSDVVFVGGFGHPPNVDAVDWMVSDIWPLISMQQPGHKFRIVGSRMPERFRVHAGPTIDPVGFVHSIDEILDLTAVSVAPLRYGAGLKGKVLTSLARGVPCVMTPTAAEGLDLPPQLEHLVKSQPETFGAEVVSLLSDETKWTSTSSDCIEFVRSRFSRQHVDSLIRAALQG